MTLASERRECSPFNILCSPAQVCLFVFNDQLLVTKGDIKKDRFQIIAKFTRDDINFRLEIMADTDGSVPVCASVSCVPCVLRVVCVTLS